MTQGAMRLSHLLYDKETYLPVIHIFIGDRKSYIKEKNQGKNLFVCKEIRNFAPEIEGNRRLKPSDERESE